MTPPPRVTSYTRAGLRFDVRDEGPADGPVVVLLHGFPQTGASWSKVAALLHAAGLRTVVPDQRGYSPGARPRRRADYRLGLLAGDAASLVEELATGPVHLVGHDWGAAVAWHLAGGRPDLVRTLTTVSVPHPRAMLRSLRTLDQARRSWYMVAFQLPWLPERVLGDPRRFRRFLARSGMDADALARVGAEIVDSGALPGALTWYRAIPLTGRSGYGGRVGVPTTHVWSDGDVALGRGGAELTGEYVDADYRLEVLPGVSHWIPEEAPARLADIVIERIASVAGT